MRTQLTRPRAHPRVLALLVLSALVLLPGCAYFNTFYHAKRFYKQAEDTRKEAEARGQTTNTASDIYKKSIDKCLKVIEEYPGSKWQDDAHLLLAKGYYGRGDYLSAERTLKKFDEQFTDSDLYPEAIFWRGLTAYAEEDYTEARDVWNRLLEEFPKSKFREEAEFYVAEAYWKDRKPEEAAVAFEKFLKDHSGSDLAASARLDLGQLLLEQDRNEEAAAVFSQVAKKGKREEDRLQAEMFYGEALEAQNKVEEALDVYSELSLHLDPEVYKGRMSAEEREALRQQELAQAALGDSLAGSLLQNPNQPGASGTQNPVNQNQVNPALTGQNPALTANNANQRTRNANDPRDRQLAQALLREGTVLGKLGRAWDAILVFEQVVAEYPRTPFAAEAQYRIGYTYEVLLEDLDQAQGAYVEVSRQGVSSFRDEADRRAKNLNTVKDLLATAAVDSLSQAKSAAAEARFMRAELYLFQQEDSERALGEYQAIEEEFSGTEHAAKAGLAIAWVTHHSLGDSTAALEKYAEVAEAYPGTEYGRRATAVVHGPEREPDPWEFAGPTVEELTDPENLAILAANLEAAAQADSVEVPPDSEPVILTGSDPNSNPVQAPPPDTEGMSLGDIVAATKPVAPGGTPDSTASSKPAIIRKDPPQRLTEVQPELEESPPEAKSPETTSTDTRQTGESATVSAVTPKMAPPIPKPEPFFWEEEKDGVNPLRPIEEMVDPEGTENAASPQNPESLENETPETPSRPEVVPVPGMGNRRWLYLDPLAVPEGGPTPVQVEGSEVDATPEAQPEKEPEKDGKAEENTNAEEDAKAEENSDAEEDKRNSEDSSDSTEAAADSSSRGKDGS